VTCNTAGSSTADDLVAVGNHNVAVVPYIHLDNYLDGAKVASNTVTHILKSTEHSRGAAYFDGWHSFSGADRQIATA
jgi:hypothetical protein